MIRILRRIFLSHAGLKASALLISIGLWIAYTSEPVVEAGYSAPLLLVNVPAGLKITGEIPSAVLLRLRGRLNRLRSFEPNELSVRADCSQTHAGPQTVYLGPNMVRLPYGAEIVGITPPEIEISLARVPAPKPQGK